MSHPEPLSQASSSSSGSTATEGFPDMPPDLGHSVTPSPELSRTVSAPTNHPPGNIPGRRRPHVQDDLNIDTATAPLQQTTSHTSRHTPLTPSAGQSRRRVTRANTFRTIEEFEEFESGPPGWKPGAEPGIDPSKPDGGQPGSLPTLHADCQITVVDFSQTDLEIHEFENKELVEFVAKPQPSWVRCRWINVNGLSWDVIQALGKYKDLHRLSIEDIMNTRNRTKVDWYSNHAFLILTCLKLVRLVKDDNSSDESEDDDDDDDHSVKSEGAVKRTTRKLRGWIQGKSAKHPAAASVLERGVRPRATAGHSFTHNPSNLSHVFDQDSLCTLQRYHAASNDARTDFMEKHSALAQRKVAVMAEQVAMFITSDNTVIAFFEQSADDVEVPILQRLKSPTTILRQSCDASMVAQAIIDAIIDMAIPVTACYSDVVGDLEVDVLTHPSIKHTKSLYIIISEINKMYSFVNPIQAVINALRDHKTKLTGDQVTRELQNPLGGVIITPMTYTYLGDVYDHCVMITESLNQIKESANHMIDLIFNTIATYQNESMKQLTTATIIFLPLTFITGYFGQNFDEFPQQTISYFWKIVIPVVIGTGMILLRESVVDWVRRSFQRRQTVGLRKKRKQKMKQRAKDRRLSSSRTTYTGISSPRLLLLSSAVPTRGRCPGLRKREISVAILGAGVAGITAAQALTNNPVTDFLILGRNDYLGGRVRSAPFGARPDDGTPYTAELGANWDIGLG
ncbi:hypothetical protein DL770_007088 [Monosporascus sp. CRB-9-2]|nr:hypothetical protein DL770_007088 [Monosporascus sp. CRB-9-2]